MRILLARIVLAAAVVAALLLFQARAGPAVEPDAAQRAEGERSAPSGLAGAADRSSAWVIADVARRLT